MEEIKKPTKGDDMANVRAKFRCNKKEADNEGGGRVELDAVTAGSPENDQFFNYTPWGKVEMGTVNENAFAQFEVGQEYYLDFTPAD